MRSLQELLVYATNAAWQQLLRMSVRLGSSDDGTATLSLDATGECWSDIAAAEDWTSEGCSQGSVDGEANVLSTRLDTAECVLAATASEKDASSHILSRLRAKT